MKPRSSTRERKPDHRIRVGHARSERMKVRILAAALEVFAEKGPEAPVVDDFVRAAGIARGTFYNHFQSVEQLLEATSVWTTGAAVHAIDQALRNVHGPAVRFGTGVRLFLASAEANPVWCRFVARAWKLGQLEVPRRDVRNALRHGEFHVPGVEAGMDVVLGGLREALYRMATGDTPRGYRDRVVEVCLQALGATPDLIAQVLSQELPPLDRPLMDSRRPELEGAVHG
jgi:AcrR family transcriptional regulator